MTDLQIIESLCNVISQQAALIRELVTQLRQVDAIREETADQLYKLDMQYDTAIGDSEL